MKQPFHPLSLPTISKPRDVVGVDLGQSRDPTAICIVRRISDPVDHIPAVEIPKPDNETAAPAEQADTSGLSRRCGDRARHHNLAIWNGG